MQINKPKIEKIDDFLRVRDWNGTIYRVQSAETPAKPDGAVSEKITATKAVSENFTAGASR